MLPSIDSYKDFFMSVYDNSIEGTGKVTDAIKYDRSLIERLTRLSLMVWEDFLNDFRQIEYDRNIPYELQESAKLYALDLLVIADSLGYDNEELLRRIALIYLIFYLNIHYFDDHVEDPDKFNGKFNYNSSLPLITQQGAAPFSFQLTCLQLLEKNLDILTKHHDIQDTKSIRDAYLRNMISMTTHLVKERKTSLSYTTVIQVKNHGIFNAWADFTATLIEVFFHENSIEHSEMAAALCSVGSLTQITDDLRDIKKDTQLGNINIFSAALETNNKENAFRLIAQVYYNEEQSCIKMLKQFIGDDKLQNIMFIPFYPFIINKAELQKQLGML